MFLVTAMNAEIYCVACGSEDVIQYNQYLNVLKFCITKINEYRSMLFFILQTDDALENAKLVSPSINCD